MDKRTAKKYACAILGIEDLWSLVEGQFDSEYLRHLSHPDRLKILAETEKLTQRIFNMAGKEVPAIVTGKKRA